MTVKNGVQSPASQKLDEAIDAVLEGDPIVPENSYFLNLDAPDSHRERTMRQAAEEGMSVVLVSSDLSIQIVSPEEILDARAA